MQDPNLGQFYTPLWVKNRVQMPCVHSVGFTEGIRFFVSVTQFMSLILHIQKKKEKKLIWKHCSFSLSCFIFSSLSFFFPSSFFRRVRHSYRIDHQRSEQNSVAEETEGRVNAGFSSESSSSEWNCTGRTKRWSTTADKVQTKKGRVSQPSESAEPKPSEQREKNRGCFNERWPL